MPDPNLIAAQQSAKAAWAAVAWSRDSFWSAAVVGALGVIVNGAVAWLAFDGPRRQRKADRDLAAQTLAHEAGKILNLQLGGLKVCMSVYLTADDIAKICAEMLPHGVVRMNHELRPNLEMNVRLIEYFLGKDIADAEVIHVMMKTKDAAENLIGALSRPALLTGDARQAYIDIGRVADHVREQCKPERAKAEGRIAMASAFIGRLAVPEEAVDGTLAKRRIAWPDKRG